MSCRLFVFHNGQEFSPYLIIPGTWQETVPLPTDRGRLLAMYGNIPVDFAAVVIGDMVRNKQKDPSYTALWEKNFGLGEYRIK